MSLSSFALKKVWQSSTKNVFQSSQGRVQIKCGLEQECMQTSRFWNRKKMIFVVYEKSTHVVKFCAQNVWLCSTKNISNPVKDFFKWNGARVGVYASLWVLKRKEFWIRVVYKKVLMLLSNFALKSVAMQFHEKGISV